MSAKLSAEQAARVASLWSAGRSAGDIARIVGKSRAAVMAVVNGAPHRPASPPQRRVTRDAPDLDDRERREPPPASNSVAPHDLDASLCAWPFGEPGTAGFHHCGGAVADPPDPRCPRYCAAHAAVAYTAPPRKRTSARLEALGLFLSRSDRAVAPVSTDADPAALDRILVVA